MPPEVMKANPKYNASVDEFSYGILMIHMFSGRWPEPQEGQTRFEGGQLIPVTEAERREMFLQAIGNDHPLMDLILKCIDNHSQTRAHTSEIVERVAEMVLQFPASFANRLEMLRQIERVEDEKRTLMNEREVENQRKDEQILRLENEAKEKDEENIRLNLVYSSEVEQLKLQVRDINAQNEVLAAIKEADFTKLKTKVEVSEDQIRHLEEQQVHDREEFSTVIAMEREKFDIELARERKSCKTLKSENHQLQADISLSETTTNSFKYKMSTLEAETLRKQSEIEAKTRALEEKEAIISGMSEQLTRTREHLSTKCQVSCKLTE